MRARAGRVRVARGRRQGAQAMVEFGLVLPLFMILTLGMVILYQFQLNINSAQFGAQEGIQQASSPSNITGSSGLLCKAARRAYDAITKESFIGSASLAAGTSGGICADVRTPDYTSSCETVATNGLDTPTYASVLGNTHIKNTDRNVLVVCAWCRDITQGVPCINRSSFATVAVPRAEDQIEIVITVAGYKPIPISLPFIGNRMPFYGQNSQEVQAFRCDAGGTDPVTHLPLLEQNCTVPPCVGTYPTNQCPFLGPGPMYKLNDATGSTTAADSTPPPAIPRPGSFQAGSHQRVSGSPGSATYATQLGGSWIQSPYQQTSLYAYSAAIWFRTTQGINGSSPYGQALITDRSGITTGGSSLTLGLRDPINHLPSNVGTVFFGIDSDNLFVGQATTKQFNDDKWHYAVGTWAAAPTPTSVVDASQFHVYVDGAEVDHQPISSGAPPRAPLNGVGPTSIGWSPAWTNPFIGTLEGAAIYPGIVLTPEVVAAQKLAGPQL